VFRLLAALTASRRCSRVVPFCVFIDVDALAGVAPYALVAVRISMQIADYVHADLIALGLEVEDKEDLLRQLVRRLVEHGRVDDTSTLMGELLKRERVMSTGIGGGIAIPHALLNDVGDLVLLFGRTSQPLDFQALDGNPVDLVFMLVGPKGAANLYVKLLARVSRLLQNDEFKQNLRKAKTAQDALEILKRES
jgi:fructose-specific phosphotransferase system IIA component